jgi:hypothetical protein
MVGVGVGVGNIENKSLVPTVETDCEVVVGTDGGGGASKSNTSARG